MLNVRNIWQEGWTAVFVYMLSIYGAILFAVGILGGEAYLAAVGVVLLLVGSVHVVAKLIMAVRRRDDEELRVYRGDDEK